MPADDAGDFVAEVVHVIVTRGTGDDRKLLMIRRANTGRGDGSWDCPAGRVEVGESLTRAAVRELAEEVGLVTTAADVESVHEEVVSTAGGLVRHVFLIATRWSGSEENREPDRADDMQWFPVTNLPSPMLPFVQRGLTKADADGDPPYSEAMSAAGRHPVFVIVSGPPASGKSTLAPEVATALGLPLIAKDTIKDALMSVLDVNDVECSRRVGRASVAAMLAVAAQSPMGAVIESNFYRSIAAAQLEQLPGDVIELFCRCTAVVAWERYQRRAGTRHAGHFDRDRTRSELWNDDVAEPVAGPWPLLEVDTNAPVDVAAVVQFVRSQVERK